MKEGAQPWIATFAHAAPGGPQLGGFWIVDVDTDQLHERLAFDDLIDLNHSPEFLNRTVADLYVSDHQ